MIDALPSELGKDSEAAARHIHGRLILGAVAALIVMAGAFAWRIANGPVPAPAPTASAAPAAKNPVLEELVEATRALQVSQQQAIDQLQVLQEQLAAQQTETRKSSGEVSALSDKLENLRHAFASVPAPPEEVDVTQRIPPKPVTIQPRRKFHRIIARRTHTASRRH